MHELTLANQVHKMIGVETEKYNAKPVAAKISCGSMTVVNDELLLEAFEAVAKGTMNEGLKLEISHKPLKGLCRACNKKFDIDLSKIKCKFCNSKDIELLPDAPFILEEIEFEVKENENKGR